MKFLHLLFDDLADNCYRGMPGRSAVILGALIWASILASYFVSVTLGIAFGIAACVWFACGFHGISRAFPTLPGAPDCLNREVKR